MRITNTLLSRTLSLGALVLIFLCGTAQAQAPEAPVTASPVAPKKVDESVLGELPITGSAEERVTKIAVLPSLSPDLEDVIVRGVVRRDLELSGMFDLIPDSSAPPGLYGFEDAVDIDAWRNVGAEVIVKVAAQAAENDKIRIFGLCYFLNVGKEPVYEKTFVVSKNDVRVTAHRITDALLGAITGRNGGFASHLAFSAKSGRNHVIFSLDADGHNIAFLTSSSDTSIAPTWGPAGGLFYVQSRNYSPFYLVNHTAQKRLDLPMKTSVYSAAFNKDKTKLAIAAAENGRSKIYVGNANGTDMKSVSTTELATHPVWSPSGKLAWVGGTDQHGTQRIYLDGKAVSPTGFAASAPTFCDTEDGVFLVFSVAVGNDRQDLVLTNERGGGVTRLTQNQGSNTYPACSPDGRLIAYFSTHRNEPGLWIKSLKSWKAQKISNRVGEALRWDALPPPQDEKTTSAKK